MKTSHLMAAALCLVLVSLSGVGCKDKIPEPDMAYHHSAEGITHKIQEQQLILSEAFKKNDLQKVHDQMYYVKRLALVLYERLEGEKKQKAAQVIKELTKLTEEIDNFAGRGNPAATEASLEKLFAVMKDLDVQVGVDKKTKKPK